MEKTEIISRLELLKKQASELKKDVDDEDDAD
jgi:hypothetical protein